MENEKSIRLSKLAREFNVGVSTLVDFLNKKGNKIPNNPNAKIDISLVELLNKEFGSDGTLKEESKKIGMQNLKAEKRETISIDDVDNVDEDADFDTDTPDNDILIKSTISHKAPEKVEIEVPKIGLTFTGQHVELDEKGEPKRPETKSTKRKETPAPAPEVASEKEKPVVEPEVIKMETVKITPPKVVAKIELDDETKLPKRSLVKKQADKQQEKPTTQEPIVEQEVVANEPVAPDDVEEEIFRTKIEKLTGPTIKGKIDLNILETRKKTPQAASPDAKGEDSDSKKKKRKRIKKDKAKVQIPEQGGTTPQPQRPGRPAAPQKPAGDQVKKSLKKKKPVKQEVDEEEVQRQIKETLARLTSKGKGGRGAKYRKEKRSILSARQQMEMEQAEIDRNILKVTEFVSANELATMMDVPVTQVIEVCMNLGLMVSINQRLDAETMALVADEFGYKVDFISVELLETINSDVEEDKEEDMKQRSPIVTVMGHVDHGKTSLLDYIRHSNVIAGEAGGITQHIGAYSVELDNDRRITFLDTPGHEAFTAMRARGAKLTDVAIIVVAADDAVMPQTVEAINHASAAGVPIVFAINKIDKPTADPEKIKSALANMNYLVEDWGGKYQCQEISAKKGTNVDKLLEKVILESDILELRANPNKKAKGAILESSLDKGRGYVATMLVETGTLRQGDIMIAGTFFGRVKAMFNERGVRITEAGPATPVQVVGLNGAPQAGDYFNIMDTDREAREVTNKREQLQRMQGLRTKKHITLEEIGRRIAIGNFQELNIVVKGDVDGSIEALSDSLIKLSTSQIQVNVIHKAVGQISESDILLAAASDAIVVGFQVRPSASSRKLAEKEEVDIRLYSIIYDAINEIKDAMEGMLSPEIKEEITGTAEVMNVFKITKVGNVAGCIVREGKIIRNNKIRLIRDGIVVYTGDLGSLKRFKDDVKEVANGFECGLNIDRFNDIKVGDIVECFQEVEVKRKL